MAALELTAQHGYVLVALLATVAVHVRIRVSLLANAGSLGLLPGAPTSPDCPELNGDGWLK